ncbi:MAG: hypothetical protein GYB49_15825 [Alphaproteobacteria bacterium]|nr:hypothetical protein [Hyphomonas sp.]MBR9808684.1 hypothetical protein [Alphaproteobacteria bacterium]|tara:strand:+ start:7623 stop:8594 length:972 start_codon:yes stop_codon:yes gene_type:complete
MRRLLIPLLLLTAPVAAEAAPLPATCPADAEQTLYDMETAIRQGTQKDLAPIVELAEWAIETCPDRPDAQAIASTLVSAVMATATTPEELERYITLALTAIQQNDYAWNTKQKPSVLKQADGSEQNYFGYNAATTSLLKYTLPQIVRLGQAGHLHPVISGPPYQGCPYPDHADFRLQEEANFWDRTVKGHYEHPGFGWAETRLNSLYAACPAHRLRLDYYLARLYGQEVEDLTKWSHQYDENAYMAVDRWYWHNPVKGNVSESDMKEAKAELDAIARPLAEKARPHIEVLRHTPRDQIGVYDVGLERIADWDKAVKRLDAPDE